jgi:hypothetical protein
MKKLGAKRPPTRYLTFYALQVAVAITNTDVKVPIRRLEASGPQPSCMTIWMSPIHLQLYAEK